MDLLSRREQAKEQALESTQAWSRHKEVLLAGLLWRALSSLLVQLSQVSGILGAGVPGVGKRLPILISWICSETIENEHWVVESSRGYSGSVPARSSGRRPWPPTWAALRVTSRFSALATHAMESGSSGSVVQARLSRVLNKENCQHKLCGMS